MPKLDWMKDTEIEDLLDGDARLIYRKCGREVLIKLWEAMPSVFIYLSTKPVNKARRRYIEQHFTGDNVRELALKLDVSAQFVYSAVQKSEGKKKKEK